MREQIERTIIENVAREMGMDEKDVHMSDRLKEDLHADSAILLVLVMDMETEFGIEVDPEGLADIKTLRDVADMIEAKTA